MISGLGIKTEWNLLTKVRKLLIPHGKLIVSGNIPVLISNKLWDRDTQMKTPEEFTAERQGQRFQQVSRHTASGIIPAETIITLVYTKV